MECIEAIGVFVALKYILALFRHLLANATRLRIRACYILFYCDSRCNKGQLMIEQWIYIRENVHVEITWIRIGTFNTRKLILHFVIRFKYSNWRTMILLCLIIYWADNILFTHFKSNYWVSQMRNKLLVYLLNFKVFEEYCTIDQILYDAETFYIIFNDTNCLGKQRICLLCLAHYLDYKDWKFIVKSTLVCGKYINI